MNRFTSRMLAGFLTCILLVGMLFFTPPGESAYADVQSRESQNLLSASASECMIQLDGDVNNNATVTSADIIYLCGFTFKGGPAPLPCYANGDINCSGTVTSADVIGLVGYCFKGTAAPCDICVNSALAASCDDGL